MTGDEKQAIDAMVELLNFCDYERLCQLAKADIDERCLVLLKNPKSHSGAKIIDEYITIEDAAKAFGIQTFYPFFQCKNMLRWAINKGDIQSIANVKPVVKGEWTDGDANCPVCGESKFKGLDADIWADWQPPFCPNCGSEMTKEEREWND